MDVPSLGDRLAAADHAARLARRIPAGARLAWEVREPGPDDFASSWHGFDGTHLVAQVVRFAEPSPAHWEGKLRGYRLEGSPTFLTAAEAMAAIDLVS
jgi:hypothetical protein